MADTTDELAGVVDLFGALTHDELEQALVELAFKQGKDVNREAFAAEIERAVDGYYLVEYNPDEDGGVSADGGGQAPSADGEPTETLLVAGPTAFPSVPENGPDLPHIMDVPDREVDREALGSAVEAHLHEESRTVAAAGDAERARELLDASYDLEAWAPVEADRVRETLDRAFE